MSVHDREKNKIKFKEHNCYSKTRPHLYPH